NTSCVVPHPPFPLFSDFLHLRLQLLPKSPAGRTEAGARAAESAEDLAVRAMLAKVVQGGCDDGDLLSQWWETSQSVSTTV
ncbi:hypothetical protein, partial [Streptomyces drozdowiczii]|uniref:hypothetical protein n=1 Tax=Streptomyces drozdowiczii TaxID=202862 RepID=UPI00403C5FC4